MPVSSLAAHVATAHRPAARAGLPWLSTRAGHIIDGQGRIVLLRGFNDDALLEDTVRPAPLDETDAALMQRSGFDVVRLPVAWSRIEPRRGQIDSAYLDGVAAAVSLLERHGMYAVLDMHFLDWGPAHGGSGAPRWATLPGVPDAQWWPWESWRRHLSPAVNADTTYFWISPDWQADFMLSWRALATRFRDDSGVAGYDIYNEPHPLPLPPRLFERDWMWPLYARTIDAIGAVDPNHLFIVEGTLFGDFGTEVVPLSAPDLVYSPHIYTGSLVPPAFTGDPGPLRRHIAEQRREAAAVPAPMWTGELGIDHHQSHAAQWVDAALDAYDDAGSGWAWWQWRESGGWGMRSASGAALDTAFLRHVARPYLVAAPSGVSAGRGDGVRGRIVLTVTAQHGDDGVPVAWPALTLAPPQTQGSCLSGASYDAAAGRLLLALQPGEACSVTITQRS